MKIIETITEKIFDEIHDGKDYAELALQCIDDHEELSQLFYELSLDEMEHMTRLHNAVVKIIEEYRKEHGEPPADMLARYKYIHEKQIKKAANVKAMQTMYKES